MLKQNFFFRRVRALSSWNVTFLFLHGEKWISVVLSKMFNCNIQDIFIRFVILAFINFFSNLVNGREGKMGVIRLLLILTMKKKCLIDFVKIKLFSISHTKRNLSKSVFIFCTISQILKTKYYVSWIQTSRNEKTIKFAIFKYLQLYLQLANFNVYTFLHVCAQNTWNFVFKIFGKVDGIKARVDRGILV